MATNDRDGAEIVEMIPFPEGEHWNVGDIVKIDPMWATSRNRHVVYRITEIKTIRGVVNYVGMPVDGGRGLRGERNTFTRASKAETDKANAAPKLEDLYKGSLVKMAGPGFNDSLGPWVVIDAKTPGKVSVAKLGGDKGRFYNNLPRSLATLITPDEAMKMLAGS